MAKLGDYVNIRTGKLDANAASENGRYPFFTCAVSTLKIDTYSYDCECVLVAGNGDLNVKYYCGKFDAYQRTYIIESKDKNVLSVRYLYYFWDQYVETLRKESIGGVIKYIKLGNLTEASIPIPPLEEQHHIVAVLDKVTDLIAQRRAQLDKLDLLVKSRFVEMFGCCNYPHKSLIDLIVEGAGLSYGIVQPGNDGTGDMGVIRPVDLVDGKISMESIKHIDRSIGDAFKKTELTGNELLITVRGTTGITALSNRDCKGMNVTRGIAVIRYDRNKINPVYLNAYLNTDESQNYIQEHTRGATLQQINLSDLRLLHVLIPPMAQQEQFANFIQCTDHLRKAFWQSLNRTEMLRKSLMQQYFEEKSN